MVPRPAGEVLMESQVARTYCRRVDFDQWGLREGCPGLVLEERTTANPQRSMSEED